MRGFALSVLFLVDRFLHSERWWVMGLHVTTLAGGPSNLLTLPVHSRVPEAPQGGPLATGAFSARRSRLSRRRGARADV